MTESELWRRLRECSYVAAVCDVLDALDHRQQAMHHRLRPLLPDRERCGFICRPRMVRWMEADYAECSTGTACSSPQGFRRRHEVTPPEAPVKLGSSRPSTLRALLPTAAARRLLVTAGFRCGPDCGAEWFDGIPYSGWACS